MSEWTKEWKQKGDKGRCYQSGTGIKNENENKKFEGREWMNEWINDGRKEEKEENR